MNENELIMPEFENAGIQINTNDLPSSIGGMIDEISDLEKEIKSSDESAKKAMDYVNNKMSRYEEKGKWIFKHRAGNTKDIVIDTQEAVKNLATAQEVSVSALRKSFEFQKKLADVSKMLFRLGCANITMNRIAVREIEAKLNGASKEQISELARQELMNVVCQLKQQEDILAKQQLLSSKVKETTSRLDKKDSLDEEQSEAIRKNAEGIKRLEEIPRKLEGTVSRLDEKDSLDKEQTEAIRKNAESIKRLEEIPGKLEGTVSRLNEKDSLDKEQSEIIQKNTEDIKRLFDYIAKLMYGQIVRALLYTVGLVAVGLPLCNIQVPISGKLLAGIAVCAALVSFLSLVVDFVRIRRGKWGRKGYGDMDE